MKKILATAVLCAGVFVFANNFAEASTKYDEERKSADQQTVISSEVQNSNFDTQQMSTKYDEERK